jgi:hypothetical protein
MMLSGFPWFYPFPHFKLFPITLYNIMKSQELPSAFALPPSAGGLNIRTCPSNVLDGRSTWTKVAPRDEAPMCAVNDMCDGEQFVGTMRLSGRSFRAALRKPAVAVAPARVRVLRKSWKQDALHFFHTNLT